MYNLLNNLTDKGYSSTSKYPLTFSEGIFISDAVIKWLSLLRNFIQQSLDSMGTILWQVLKTFNLFRLLQNEAMVMLSIGGRNKSKHELVWMKHCGAEKCKINIL